MKQQEVKSCQNCKKDFTIEPDDFGFYEKIKVPPPTFCPECRKQRRLAWRNLFNYYKSTCGLTGASIISLYPPSSGITAYSPKVWYSDKWNAFDYGQNYNFSRSFFEQYVELLRKVPRPAMDTDDGLLSKNCEYTNDFAIGKNCYLVTKSWKTEDVMYSFYVVSGKDLVDVHLSFGKDEGNYETINTEHCYKCKYIEDCQTCSDSAFCFDCRNCDKCFMCVGLRGKSYFLKNEYVGKEKYEKILREYALQTYSGIEKAKKEFEPILRKYPRKPLRTTNCNKCIGDFIYNSRDCKNCFVTLSSEHYKYGDYTDGIKDAMDVDAGGGSELVYESDITAFCSNVIGSFYTWHCQDSYYLSHTFRSKDCFGCVGLKDAQYCILNKKYSKEEYFKLKEQIIKQMDRMPYIDKKGIKYYFGEFSPAELSLFGYNESMAEEQFPMTKDEIIKKGYKWQENFQKTTDKETLLQENIPDSIDNIAESILEEILTCAICKRNYKIIQDELSFYKKMKIPIPRRCFYCRNTNRIRRRNPFKLWHRACMCNKANHGHTGKCETEFETSYALDRPEIVYCERCYQQEVY